MHTLGRDPSTFEKKNIARSAKLPKLVSELNKILCLVSPRQGPRLTLGSQTGEGTPKKVVF